MINYSNVMKENITKHNLNWSWIPDHPSRILIIRGSGSGKTNALVDDDDYKNIDKIYLYVKDLYEAKYQHLIKNMKKWSFIEYLCMMLLMNTTHSKKCNVLIVFDDIITD